jgi:hypothetical protein
MIRKALNLTLGIILFLTGSFIFLGGQFTPTGAAIGAPNIPLNPIWLLAVGLIIAGLTIVASQGLAGPSLRFNPVIYGNGAYRVEVIGFRIIPPGRVIQADYRIPSDSSRLNLEEFASLLNLKSMSTEDFQLLRSEYSPLLESAVADNFKRYLLMKSKPGQYNQALQELMKAEAAESLLEIIEPGYTSTVARPILQSQGLALDKIYHQKK